MKKTTNHYTFGDNSVAALRLEWLADTFEESSRRFLRRAPRLPVTLAYDLGCGPGFSTDLLADVHREARVEGVDSSESFVAQARVRAKGALARSPTSRRHHQLDLTASGWALPPADLVYCRFLLTHLSQPVEVLTAWRSLVRPGGLLLSEETAELTSDHPAFARYYALVSELQSRHDQQLEVGRGLPLVVERAGWEVLDARLEPLEVPASRMARLHALNLQTWRHDPALEEHPAQAELPRLLESLTAIADGTRVAPPVRVALRQTIARRPGGAS